MKELVIVGRRECVFDDLTHCESEPSNLLEGCCLWSVCHFRDCNTKLPTWQSVRRNIMYRNQLSATHPLKESDHWNNIATKLFIVWKMLSLACSSNMKGRETYHSHIAHLEEKSYWSIHLIRKKRWDYPALIRSNVSWNDSMKTTPCIWKSSNKVEKVQQWCGFVITQHRCTWKLKEHNWERSLSTILEPECNWESWNTTWE